MGDHVGPGEVARRRELVGHLLVEAQVEVDALIGGAVEGADGRGGAAAAVGVDGVAVEDQLGVLVRFSIAPECPLPRALGVGEHVGRELLDMALRVLRRRNPLRGRLAGRLHAGAEARGDIEASPVSAEKHLNRDVDEQAHDPEPAREREPPGTGSRDPPPPRRPPAGLAPRWSITSRGFFTRRHLTGEGYPRVARSLGPSGWGAKTKTRAQARAFERNV